ncbi:hypothetical protein [Streptobacillus moniliformis]|uniref:Uncharacterized protein n=1 Tax=Streptobacillus moniliformis (strain ATCC 14647 / DSM 12112 / NCTC 10651 / 9901) TaxID=519441 RepID=D1AYE7_STRM9|nr:hypothetical protein [Streptobacillus moniliformis]ACZ01323.1 hypothetical protein Smon_0855 [Streptobacillus moniliformis DSM 12112]AVL43655.1 hypothetical protein CEP89_07570 [Streptobacillus moniliformis]SQA13519.1 Uncharacterised protein [Streptobacillus moniliformis]
MFWNLFKKKEEYKDIEREKIKVYDDEKGEEIIVVKEDWIKKFLIPKIDQNINNREMLYNLILVGLNYQVYEELLEHTLKFREMEENSKRSTEVLTEIYFQSSVYNEIVELYEDYKDEMSPMMYYYYGLSLLYTGLDLEYVETILEGLYSYPNNDKLIGEFKEIFKNKNYDVQDKYMQTLSNLEGAYKLSIYFSEVEYINSNYNKANEYIVKALNQGNYKTEVITEVTKILFENKQYIEFENHILIRYSVESKDIEFTKLALLFYKEMFRYEDGLKLTKELYSYRKYYKSIIKLIAEYEEEYLRLKFKSESPASYDAATNCREMGEVKYFNISHPMHYYILNRDEKLLVEKNSDKNVMFLPIATLLLNKLDTKESAFINTLPIILLEKIYRSTNVKMQVTLSKDDVSIKEKMRDYDEKFFEGISNANPQLKYIITGLLDEENLGTKYLNIYRYDCEKKQIFKMISPINIKNNEVEIAKEYIESIKEYFGITVFDLQSNIEIDDIYNCSKRLNLFFDFDGNNKYRKWNLLYLLNYYISKIKNEDELLIALSIVHFMNIYKVEYDLEYKSIFYEKNLQIYDNPEIRRLINFVFENRGE